MKLKFEKNAFDLKTELSTWRIFIRFVLARLFILNTIFTIYKDRFKIWNNYILLYQCDRRIARSYIIYQHFYFSLFCVKKDVLFVNRWLKKGSYLEHELRRSWEFLKECGNTIVIFYITYLFNITIVTQQFALTQFFRFFPFH